jgi:hypothetical protein
VPVELVVKAGRPLRVALDRRIRRRRVGQPATGPPVEDVYARDRVVLPAGTKVAGHVERLAKAPKGMRVRAIMSVTSPRCASSSSSSTSCCSPMEGKSPFTRRSEVGT